MRKVLSGVRILDFTDALSGPFCTRYLADCGCEVISIEKPGGKMTRAIPYFHQGQAVDYLYNHCGKKSIVIDLKNPKAYDLIMRFAKECDVVVENFRPGVMKEYGFDYDSFKKVNPKIIMCSISGWGQTSPKAELMAADLSVQSQSGILDLTGDPDGPPSLVGFPVTDILGGLNAFGAICAALYRRTISGEGDYIDISMLDTAFATLHMATGMHLLSEGKDELHRAGRLNASGMSAWGIYKGRDGYIAISAATKVGWERLANIMGKPELADDPRFNTQALRFKNNKEVTDIIEAWLKDNEMTTSEVASLLQSYRMQSVPVLSVAQLIDGDEHFKQSGMLKELEHGTLGKVKFINSPLKYRNSGASADDPPPANAGDHTEYILQTVLKMGKDDISELKKAGVVAGK